MLFVPLAAIFAEALRKGVGVYFASFTDRARAVGDPADAARSPAICVPLNLVFGLAAAWAIAKFQFPRQEPADHADRPAVRRVAGHLRA